MLSNVSKMPGKSISLSAFDCITGGKLSKIPGSVCHECYARKGMYRMPNVINKMKERKAFFNSIDFVPRMVELLNKTRSDYFRWFDSGDVQDIRMALNIIDVIEATPDKKHWIPTKEATIWRDALKIKPLPSNAILRVSGTMVDGTPPKAFPHTSLVVKDNPPVGHECPAPKQQGKCSDCRACWDHDVANVTYHKH